MVHARTVFSRIASIARMPQIPRARPRRKRTALLESTLMSLRKADNTTTAHDVGNTRTTRPLAL